VFDGGRIKVWAHGELSDDSTTEAIDGDLWMIFVSCYRQDCPEMIGLICQNFDLDRESQY